MDRRSGSRCTRSGVQGIEPRCDSRAAGGTPQHTFVTGSRTMGQYVTEDEALAAAMSETDFGADRVASRPGRRWFPPSLPRLPRCGPSGTLPSRIALNASESTGPESLSTAAPRPSSRPSRP